VLIFDGQISRISISANNTCCSLISIRAPELQVPATGPVGAFMVDSNGTIAAVLSEDTNLKSDISSRLGNSLTQLKNSINPPTPPTACDPVQAQASQESLNTEAV
jgi:hypothetical protein